MPPTTDETTRRPRRVRRRELAASTTAPDIRVGWFGPVVGGKTEDVRGFEGTVELTKSEAAAVEGKIDLKKDGVSVKGAFKAKLK